MSNYSRSELTNFETNLKVWSRRMNIPNLAPKAEKIASSISLSLGRQAAIYAIAADWLCGRGLSRDLIPDAASLCAASVYDSVYRDGKACIGVVESIVRSPIATKLVGDFVDQAKRAYRQDKGSIPSLVQARFRESSGKPWDE